MRINWKVRVRNRQFWLGVVGALGALALSLADALGFGGSASPWVEAIEGAASAALTVLALLGVVVDPTTEGMGDSRQALRYEKPKSDNETEGE